MFFFPLALDAAAGGAGREGFPGGLSARAPGEVQRAVIAPQIRNATSATGGIIYGPPQQVGVCVKVGFGP